MVKYTDMEQAVQDSALAIITENITSLRELNRAYAKYRVLPKKLKRYSNYYSNEFLGHNVIDMYFIVKDKLRDDGAGSPAAL